MVKFLRSMRREATRASRRNLVPLWLGNSHRGGRHGYGLRTEDKLRVAKLSHFRNIQTRQLSFRRNPLPDKNVKHQVQHETEGEDKAQQSGNTHKLSSKLAETIAAIEQSSD